ERRADAPPTRHTSARGVSPNGGCGRSATKVGSYDYSSQLSYRCFRCVDPCASYCSTRKRHCDPRCAGSTRLLCVFGSATNRLPLSLWKLRGGALIHAADEGLLRHIPQANLDYDIGRWSTLEV